MVEKLSVEIGLEGGEELKRQFDAATASIAKLGNTAEEAFAGATAAAQKFGASTQDFQKVEGVIRVLAARARDSSIPFAELAANYDRARQSAASFVPAAAQVEQATKKLGESSRGTRLEIDALARGLGAIGVGGGPVVTALAAIGSRLGPIALAAAAISGTTAALIKFANAAEETEKSLSQLQVASGRSFENLSALAQVFAEGGTSTKQFASEFGNLSEKIAAAAQENNIRAASKDTVEWANDIDRVRHQFDNLAGGVRTTFDPLTKLDTKVKAVLESVARVKPDEQIFRLADIFKNLATDMERAQLGKALGLSSESIASLNLGGSALRAMAEEAKQVGLILNDVDKNNLRGMRAAQVEAIGLFDQLKQKIGALVAPELTSFWDGFRNLIASLAPTFMELTESAKRGLQSLSTDFGFIYAQVLKIIEGWGFLLAAFAKSDFKASLDPFVEQLRHAVDGLNMLVAIGATWVGQKVFGITAEQAAELQRQIKGVQDETTKLTEKTREQTAATAEGTANTVQASNAETQHGNAITNTTAATSQASTGVNDYIAIVNKAIEAQRRQTEALNQHIEAMRRARVAAFEAAGLRDKMTGQLDIAAYDTANMFASGGFVGGTGTGTSDSNLAWVSRGEHIMPARAVAQPGVMAFLEALRHSGGNLSRVLDGMGRFALGGMVPRAMPAFATGGLAGGMSNVTIQFPGLPAIGGLRASSDVVDQLHKAAALAQVRSGGRKPSRYS